MSVVELAKPSGVSKLKWAVRARLSFGAPTIELVTPGGNDHARSDLEGCKKDFSMWIPVQLEAVACFQSDINGSHEVLPRFENAARICDSTVLVLNERLSNPA